MDPPLSLNRTVLSNANGLFVIPLATFRSFRIRVDMIGYEPWTSDELRPHAAADVVQVEVRLQMQPISLAGLVAESRRRCNRIGRGAGLPTQTLWRNVTTALQAERFAKNTQLLHFDIETFQRDVTADSQVVIRDVRQRASGQAIEAFRPVSSAHLQNMGFFYPGEQGGYLLGPTADIMLDPWFTDTHCMGVTAPGQRPGSIGVTFAPVSDRGVTEIRGVIWLDSATFDLQTVEFEHVRVPRALPGTSYTGTLSFTRLGNGGVILTEWVMRSPRIEAFTRLNARLSGGREVGGNVLRAGDEDAVLFQAQRGTVEGTVSDAGGAPMAEAEVFLRGTEFRAYTNSAGRFTLADLPAGVYHLTFEHTSLAQKDDRPTVTRIVVQTGLRQTIDLTVRSSGGL
jgi:hypothetical protein